MSLCAASGCSNRGGDRHYFSFPLSRPKQLAKWLTALKMRNFTPTRASKLCSDHFLRSDLTRRPGTSVPKLRPNAVPSVLPPDSTRTTLADSESEGQKKGGKSRVETLSCGNAIYELSFTVPVTDSSSEPESDRSDTEVPANDSSNNVDLRNTPGVTEISEVSTVSVIPELTIVTESKSSQTVVTLQQSFNEAAKWQQQTQKLRRELQSAKKENERLQKIIKAQGPGSIRAPVRSKMRGNAIGAAAGDRIPTDPDDIWDINDVDLAEEHDDLISDPRHRPQVDVTYKQKVGSEDMFLQVTQKTPMTSSCETMVLTLTMRGENKASIDCDIAETSLDVRSPIYRLHLPLPHEVNPDTASAEWNPATSQLVVTLELVRELDNVNF